MKKRDSLLYHIVLFILAQLAWLSLLGLWIYWYVYNYIVFEKVGDRASPQLNYDITNLVPFVVGLVLLVGLLVITTWIFRNLNLQLRINKLYDNFIGNVTHELKSPLSSIQLYLETLSSRDVPRDKQKEFINLMMADTKRLNHLINTILQVSALEQKKLVQDFDVYNADSVLKEIIHNSVEQFRLSGDEITIEGNVDCDIVIDKAALKVVFDNLIDNAIKYSLNGVRIKIKLKCTISKVIIEFIDNGIGIPLKEQKNIFNKFHRIYRDDIPNVKGTGLGLYWVRENIKNIGGDISVSSGGRNKGCKFTIEIPVYFSSKSNYAKRLLKKSARRKRQVKKDEE